MRNYRTILMGLIIFAVVFVSSCQPEPKTRTGTAVITAPAEDRMFEASTEPPAVTTAPVEAAPEEAVVAEPEPAEPQAPETPAEPSAATESAVEAAPKPPVVPEPAVKAADAVFVTVNGADITEGELEESVKPQLAKMASQLPPQFVEQYKKQLMQQAAERMIVEQLLDKKVKENNIVVMEEETVEAINTMASKQELSLDDFKALLEAYGQSFDNIKQRIRRGLGYQKIIEAQFDGKVNVTEEDAQKYYSENAEQFKVPEQVRASHILITPDTADPNSDPNQAEVEAMEEARQLLVQLKDGADFATLAKANSGCPSAAKGGDLGLFGKGQMVPEFEQAAFGLEVGQLSDVVKTQFGYHIIKLTEHKDASVTSFEQAKDDIFRQLTQEKKGELAKQYIESLKAEADIVYTDAGKPDAQEPNAGDTQPK